MEGGVEQTDEVAMPSLFLISIVDLDPFQDF